MRGGAAGRERVGREDAPEESDTCPCPERVREVLYTWRRGGVCGGRSRARGKSSRASSVRQVHMPWEGVVHEIVEGGVNSSVNERVVGCVKGGSQGGVAFDLFLIERSSSNPTILIFRLRLLAALLSTAYGLGGRFLKVINSGRVLVRIELCLEQLCLFFECARLVEVDCAKQRA